MNSVRPPNPRLDSVVPYDPKYLPAHAMMSANENPSNIPEEVRRAVMKRLKSLDFNRYPDPLANELREAIAEANGLEKENILLGNGGDELLFDIALAWGGEGRTFLNLPPTFSVYENNAQLTGTTVVNIPRRADYSIDEEAVFARVAQGDIDYIIIASPNNPTGQLASEEFLLKLLDATDALVMVDEAYFEFSRTTMRVYLQQHENLLVLRTFSKAFSLAGVRMGYILANPSVITEFIKVRQPYSVDAVSQAIALEVFRKRAVRAGHRDHHPAARYDAGTSGGHRRRDGVSVRFQLHPVQAGRCRRGPGMAAALRPGHTGARLQPRSAHAELPARER